MTPMAFPWHSPNVNQRSDILVNPRRFLLVPEARASALLPSRRHVDPKCVVLPGPRKSTQRLELLD
jgi:hypothetical protein